MLIDFHTHVFPERIAPATIAMLCHNMEKNKIDGLRPSYDGTAVGLRRFMRENKIDISVIMPIATKPSQFKSINNYAQEISHDGIISFGSLHPYQEDMKERVRELAERGFIGIKLHPDYQGVPADDDKMVELVRCATECGLYVTLHSGEDAGVLPPFKSTLEHMLPMLSKVDASRVILAHMGAFNEWDEVEKHLCGSPAYFDISMAARFMDIEQYRRIIDRHGADKMLFGSDGPWEPPQMTLAMLRRAELSPSDMELITHKNAEKILGIH